MLQIKSQIQRCLSTKLHNNAGWLLLSHDVQNIFECKRFEIEPVGSVIVRGNSFGTAVDHDGLIALLLESERRMAAAIIKLDALPDPVRTASKNYDFLTICRLSFVFFFVRGV